MGRSAGASQGEDGDHETRRQLPEDHGGGPVLTGTADLRVGNLMTLDPIVIGCSRHIA